MFYRLNLLITRCIYLCCIAENINVNENIFGSNIEYNPKFLGKIKKALKFQCLYRSFYFHWLKQSG